MNRNSDLIKILIPAVGGQGGGVLTEWLVQVFLIEGFEVQGVGLPGLSQRGGSTIYYLESYSKIRSDRIPIIFSQYPLPGDIDIILAQEFLELGRVLELGYGSNKTTIVSSTHRIYSTLEKMPVSSGIYSDENLHKLANAFSTKFVGLNALDLAKEFGMDELAINAILLGALGASGSLPIAEASYLKAISQVGVAVENNIKAFRIGWDHVKSNKYKLSLVKSDATWDELKKEKLSRVDPSKREDFFSLLLKVEDEYPERLREILAESLYRLTDYQDIWYAEKYLDTLKNIYQ
ncbi:MAG: 2-oxoacid:acceptor oxidoreductase family protein, partial [Deltaproteobacteria bacterium]|nr:2-oxoacid:acceptor oxidoreductase family protein [Deltaproteobacteria bacterium]